MSDAIASTAATAAPDRQALVELVVANPDLEQLESLLDQFNIFEAIGVARQELRHSDFLAFLLDPRQSHRLGDAFVKRLLQKALMTAEDGASPISPIDLDVWSLEQMTVLRECRNIDLLLVDEPHRLVVIVENKIGSGEHSDQLDRYAQIVHDAYRDWRVLGLYLTPDGDAPSDERYIAIDYDLVCETVEGLAESRSSTLDPAVHAAMTHYARMLRRHVVSDSDIAELCQRIYQRHKRALDLIYEHRPDRQAAIKDVLVALIESTSHLVLDDSHKRYIRFGHVGWDTPALMSGRDWTRSGRMLLFQFENVPEKLNLNLWIGPGPVEIRQRLIETARAKRPPFRVRTRETTKWLAIFGHQFLGPADYAGTTAAEIEARIEQKWASFVDGELGQIVAALAEATGGAHEDAAPVIPGRSETH